jgi:hypothetical protein
MTDVYFKPTKNFLINQYGANKINWTNFATPPVPRYQTIALALIKPASSAHYDPLTATRPNYTNEYVGGSYPNGNSSSLLGGTFVGNSYASILEPVPDQFEFTYYFGSYNSPAGSPISITWTGLTGTIGGAVLYLSDTGNAGLNRTVIACATLNKTYSSASSMTIVIPAKFLTIPLHY